MAPPVITATAENGVQLYIDGDLRMVYESSQRKFDVMTAHLGATVTV